MREIDGRSGADAPSGSQASPGAASASPPSVSIPNAFRALAERLPEGLRWKYEVTFTGNRVEYLWALVGPRGAIHVSAWPDSLPQFGRDWMGGIEAHSPIRQEYSSEEPSHEHCWLLGGPCWHDGSSLQFSEQVGPYLPGREEEMGEREHLLVLGTMLSRYHSWLPTAQAIEARRAATAKTGAVEDESAVHEVDAPK